MVSSGESKTRPADPGDLADLLELAAVADAPDGLRDALRSRDLELAADVRVATRGGGIVGVALLPRSSPVGGVHWLSLLGVVHPQHRGRGLGRELLTWQLEQAIERHRASHPELRGVLMARCPADAEADLRLYSRVGLRPAARTYTMVRQLTGGTPIVDPGDPDGHLAVTTIGIERSEDVRAAHNDAFVPRTGVSLSQEFWDSRRMGSDDFRPDLSRLAVTPSGEIAAFVIAYDHGGGAVDLGQIGTRPEFQGRGLASLLITRSMLASAAAGYDRATLQVDADNSAALRVYDRLGFTVGREYVRNERELPAATVANGPTRTKASSR